MLSPNQLVPDMFPVLAKKKLEMCCAVSIMGTEIAVRKEAAPVFPLPLEAAVCRSVSWMGLGTKELWTLPLPSFARLSCSLLWISISHADGTGWSKELQGISSLLYKFLTQLLRRQQQTQSLLLALLPAVFQSPSAEPTNYMYFNLSYIWRVSDEILSKIFVLFTIYSDIMSVLVINTSVGGFKL